MEKLLDYLHHIPWEQLRKDYGFYGEAISNTYLSIRYAVEQLLADQIEASYADWVVSKNSKVVFRLSQFKNDIDAYVHQGILTQEQADESHRNVAASGFQALGLIIDKDPVIQHHLKIKFRNNKKIIVTIQAPDQMDNSPNPSSPQENTMQKLIDYLHHIPWEQLQLKYGSTEAITKTYQVLLGAVKHYQADHIEASRADYVLSKNGKVVFKLSKQRGQGILAQEEDELSHGNVAARYFDGLQRILEVDQVVQQYFKIKFRNNKKIIVTIQASDQNG